MEFYGQHTIESGENAVTKIVALPNEVSTAIYSLLTCYQRIVARISYAILFSEVKENLNNF